MTAIKKYYKFCLLLGLNLQNERFAYKLLHHKMRLINYFKENRYHSKDEALKCLFLGGKQITQHKIHLHSILFLFSFLCQIDLCIIIYYATQSVVPLSGRMRCNLLIRNSIYKIPLQEINGY